LLRGQRVIVDKEPAALYGVTTKRLNEQVKRNRGRAADPEEIHGERRSALTMASSVKAILEIA
jgi:ORF6N domain